MGTGKLKWGTKHLESPRKREQVWNSISLPSSLFWLVCLPLSLLLVNVRLSIHLGNCGSALLETSSVPSQGQQPGGDAQEDPPFRIARPPQDPVTGVCLVAVAVWKSKQSAETGLRNKEEGHLEGFRFFSPSCNGASLLSRDFRRRLLKRASHSGNW